MIKRKQRLSGCQSVLHNKKTLPTGMTELREMRGGAAPGSAAWYSRLEGTDDSIRIKVRTLDNESTWEVEGEGSWTVRQFKDHVGVAARAPLHVRLAAAPLPLPPYACSPCALPGALAFAKCC